MSSPSKALQMSQSLKDIKQLFFDPTRHQPPRVDIHGYNLLPKHLKPQHPFMTKAPISQTSNNPYQTTTPAKNDFQNILGVLGGKGQNIPAWWTERSRTIDGQGVNTRSQILEERKKDKKPKEVDEERMRKILMKIQAKREARFNGYTQILSIPGNPSPKDQWYRKSLERSPLQQSPRGLELTQSTIQEEDSLLNKTQDLTQTLIDSSTVQNDETVPRYHSVKQIRAQEHRDARIKAGLLPEGTIHKSPHIVGPSLKYIEKPLIATKSHLNLNRDEIRHQDALDLEGKVGVHKLGDHRLKQREDARLRFVTQRSDDQNKTSSVIKQQRQGELLSELKAKYDKDFQGFSGYKPKFSDLTQSKQWWKFQNSYQELPTFQSQVELQEMTRHLAKPDLLKVSNFLPHKSSPQDPFKGEPNFEGKGPKDVPDKPTNTSFWKMSKKRSIPLDAEGGNQFLPQYQFQQSFAAQAHKFIFKPNQRLLDRTFQIAVSENKFKEQRVKNDEEWHSKQVKVEQQQETEKSNRKNEQQGKAESQQQQSRRSIIKSRQIQNKLEQHSISQQNLNTLIQNATSETSFSRANASLIDNGDTKDNLLQLSLMANTIQFVGKDGSVKQSTGLAIGAKRREQQLHTLMKRVASGSPDAAAPQQQENPYEPSSFGISHGSSSTRLNSEQEKSLRHTQSYMMGKTIQNSNSHSSFRNTAQRGIFSGAGMLSR
ncbi:hypothetical protein FGO68_gene14039 [Halteria grandinella]|uniref:Uncharacterized protein n=1 Tax=Halteria grandinella TaxID=5974 RepID=A0A8J8NV19_HALGN|nr:hypothetical protein FGO68_gene14039 [Halteria grandinella]